MGTGSWLWGLLRSSWCAGCVGLYLRATQRHSKDGSQVRYVQLAHNERVGGVTRAKVLLNLGREDQLDLDGLRRLAASITRFTDGDGGGVPVDEGPAGEFDVEQSRPLGAVWLPGGLWRVLGVDRALAGVLGSRRFATEVERVLCGSPKTVEAPAIRSPHVRPRSVDSAGYVARENRLGAC